VIQAGDKAVARQGGNIAVYFCTPEGEVLHVVAGPVNPRRFIDEARWAVDTCLAAFTRSGGERDDLVKAMKEAHAARRPARAAECGGLEGVVADYTAAIRTVRSETATVYTVKEGEATIVLAQALKAHAVTAGGHVTTDLLYRPALAAHADSHRLVGRALLVLAAAGGRDMHGYLADRGLPKVDEIYKDVFEHVLGEIVSDKPVQVMDMAQRCLRLTRAVRTQRKDE